MAYVKNPVPLVSGFGIALGFKRLARQRPSVPCTFASALDIVFSMLMKSVRFGSSWGRYSRMRAMPAITQPLPRAQKFVSLPLWSRYMRPAWLLKRNIWLSQYIVFIVAKYFLSPVAAPRRANPG